MRRLIDRLSYLANVYLLRKGSLGGTWALPMRIGERILESRRIEDGWYLDFSREASGEILRDSEGIPVVDYANIGVHHNPWYVSQIALGTVELFARTGHDCWRKDLRRYADWFVESAVPSGDGVTWNYNFDWHHGRRAPWISALSQGQAIAVLLRAASLLEDESYRDVAAAAVRLFRHDLRDGGLTFRHEDGTVSFEEVVSPEYFDFPITTFNGHISASWAIMEWAEVSGEALWQDLFERSWRFVLARMEDFDCGFWSCYNLYRGRFGMRCLASSRYQDVHLAQMLVLHDLTEDVRFKEAATRFSSYLASPVSRFRATASKTIFKVLYF